MKKRTRKMKTKKATAPIVKKISMLEIPEDLKPFVRKKFRVRPTTGEWVLVVRTVDDVDAVATLKHTGYRPQTAVATIVRDFKIPAGSTLPVDMWRSCNRQLAIWYARWWSRHHIAPSAKSERSRRKRIWKKAAARAAAHADAKLALQNAGVVGKPPAKAKVVPVSSFICTYDPKALRDERTVFELHRTDCTGLDHARNRAVRHGGDTWVIEAH